MAFYSPVSDSTFFIILLSLTFPSVRQNTNKTQAVTQTQET